MFPLRFQDTLQSIFKHGEADAIKLKARNSFEKLQRKTKRVMKIQDRIERAGDRKVKTPT